MPVAKSIIANMAGSIRFFPPEGVFPNSASRRRNPKGSIVYKAGFRIKSTMLISRRKTSKAFVFFFQRISQEHPRELKIARGRIKA